MYRALNPLIWRMCTEDAWQHQLVPVPREEGVETQRIDAKQTEICTCGCKANRNMHRCWSQSPCLVLYCVFPGCLISDGIKVPKTPCLAKMQTNSLRSFRGGCLVLHWTFSSYLQSLEFCFPPDKLCAFWQTSTKCCEMQDSAWSLLDFPQLYIQLRSGRKSWMYSLQCLAALRWAAHAPVCGVQEQSEIVLACPGSMPTVSHILGTLSHLWWRFIPLPAFTNHSHLAESIWERVWMMLCVEVMFRGAFFAARIKSLSMEYRWWKHESGD